MEKNSTKIAIIVAIIGLIGTLGGSFLANIDKFFPKDQVTKTAGGEDDQLSRNDTSICVPELRVPAEGAVLPQLPIGEGKYESKWLFGWQDCPEAEKYHLYVIGPGALNPIVDISNLSAAAYQYRHISYGITKLHGWSWKVRAYVDGRWGEWSEEHYFDVSSK